MKNLKGKYRKNETALKAIKLCLEHYYRLSDTPRNQWRFDEALEQAKKDLKEHGVYRLEGAQWGGKWGNYKRCVALNSKGVYTYTEGFDADIKRALS